MFPNDVRSVSPETREKFAPRIAKHASRSATLAANVGKSRGRKQVSSSLRSVDKRRICTRLRA